MSVRLPYIRSTTRANLLRIALRRILCASLWVVLLGACAKNEAPAREASSALRIALHGEPASLDPYLQSEVVAQSILGHVYETLVRYDEDMGIVPSLAAHWENLDPLTLRVHLQPNVVFHDGRPLTAADVVASFKRAREHPRSKASDLLVAVDSVREIHHRTLEIRTLTPYPILLHKLAFLAIVPKEASEIDEIEAPIGTGPYRFVRSQLGESVLLEAWDEYRDGPPPIRRTEFLFVNDADERAAMLRNGLVDVINDLPPAQVRSIEHTKRLRVEQRSSLVVYYLQLRPTAAPFDDLRVRRALDVALDRGELVASLLRGYGSSSNQLIGPDIVGYHPDLPPPHRDVDEARRQLAEAGYADGLELELEYRDGFPAAPLIQAQWAEAGVRVRLTPQPWSRLVERLDRGEVALYAGGWANTSSDVSDLLDRKIHCRNDESGYGRSNYSGLCDPQLDEAIRRAGGGSLDARREALHEALERLAEHRVYLPLYSPHDLYGLRGDLDWKPRPDGRIYAFEMRETGEVKP